MRKQITFLAVLAGCSPSRTPETPVHSQPATKVEAPALAAPIVSPPEAPDVEAPFPADIRSVRFIKTTVLLTEPRSDAPRMGVVRKGTRAAPVKAMATADLDCGRWVSVAPRGWTCETAIEPSSEEPSTAVPMSLSAEPARRLVPGSYATVRGNSLAFESRTDAEGGVGRPLVGSNSIRIRGSVMVSGKKFLKTSGGDLIESTSVRRFSPSKFRGIVLDADAPLPAWVRGAADAKKPVAIRRRPGLRAKVVKKVPARTVLEILATSDDGKWLQIGERAWIARKDVRMATLASPPEGVGEDERWLDVNLDEQTLVAYEGSTPVYATLVSTGKRKHRTPTGITRITAKHERATMRSDDGEIYSVADVPWTMNYADNGYALHTAYWHDGFGGPRSHGCVNLSPHDARILYHWSSPDVPPGWIAVYGDETYPGSLVRVRSADVPSPPFRGYARRLLEIAKAAKADDVALRASGPSGPSAPRAM